MITKDNTISISNLRRNVSEVIGKVKNSGEPLYVFRRSNPQAVMLSIEYFNELLEKIEDRLDARELLSVSDKELDEASSWDEFKEPNFQIADED